jgi:hypothetical protein
MTVTINASTSSGLISTADTSGALALQTAGTTAVTFDTSQNTTFVGNINTATGKKYQVNSTTVNALAWVNFAGTTGTVRASYNVSSVTRASTGLYTVNFATALADANYAVSASAGSGGSVGGFAIASYQAAPTTSAFTLVGVSIVSTITDYTYVTAMVFGN